MNTRLALLLGSVLTVSAVLQAQTTAFTFQGRLDHGGAPANGLYEMYFTLHDAFGLGASDRAIATVGADGVAMAAIQGLNQKLEWNVETSQHSTNRVIPDLYSRDARA